MPVICWIYLFILKKEGFLAAFFLNPISHEPGYRLHVIHRLPSIQVLDKKGKIYRHSEGLLVWLVFLNICQ